MFERLRSLIANASQWTWPVKFAAGAALSALAGGSLLAFLLQYAAYHFALTYGFRPAVEGVPYLSAMVTFGSVSLLLLAAALSLFVVTVMKFFFMHLGWLEATANAKNPSIGNLFSRFSSLSFPIFLVIAVPLNIIFILLYQYLNSFMPLEPICAWPILICAPDDPYDFWWNIAYFSVGFFVSLMIWRPRLVWLGTLSLVALFYLGVGASVLPSEGYARMLRMTGFGGGLRVSVQIAEADGKQVRTIETHLLMRSSAYLTVYDIAAHRIDELPLSLVSRVGYHEGGLHNVPHALPPRVNIIQR